MHRLTKSFDAVGNDGRQYTVDVYTNFIPAPNFEDPGAEVEGLKRLQTSSGLLINYLSPGEYQIVQTGVILRSAAPDAP
jgi:hypothetical protein